MKFWYIYGNTFSKYLHGTWSLLNILMIFGIKENLIIWTHTMYFWQLLQIYSSDLRLVLWSRITVFIFFEVGLPVIYIRSIYCIFKHVVFFFPHWQTSVSVGVCLLFSFTTPSWASCLCVDWATCAMDCGKRPRNSYGRFSLTLARW